VNCREIVHTRLEALAGADNPGSLIATFELGHLVIKAGGADYVTRCAPIEIEPRSHQYRVEENPAIYNGTEIFVNPISYVIKPPLSLPTAMMWPSSVQARGVNGTAANYASCQ
jgi:hypothetical protein